MALPDEHAIETVDGAEEAMLADELIAFWNEGGVLSESQAQERLPHVIGLIRDGGGAIVASSSAIPTELSLVGGRRFWLFRYFAATPTAEQAWEELLHAAFELLSARSDEGRRGPLGVCLAISDLGFMREHDEAVWPLSGLQLAGYTAAGEQVRIRYFQDAVIL